MKKMLCKKLHEQKKYSILMNTDTCHTFSMVKRFFYDYYYFFKEALCYKKCV